MQTLYQCEIKEEQRAAISKLNASGLCVSSVIYSDADGSNKWFVAGADNVVDAAKIAQAGRLAYLFDNERMDEYSKIPIADIVAAVELRNYHMASE